MNPPEEVERNQRASVAFFGSKRTRDGPRRLPSGLRRFLEALCWLPRERVECRRDTEEVVASCGQKGLAEYSRSGLRTREDTTSLRREDVARTLNTA
jgi:hypothetical protein